MFITHKNPSTSWGRSLTRRTAGTAITAILATALAAGSVAPAHASLVGPIGTTDPVTGYPMSYSDGAVALSLCIGGTQCLAQPPNTGAELSFPGNFPDEAFWFSAAAGTDLQPQLYGADLEAAFLGGAPVDGEQQAFARLRFRLDGLTPNTPYTIQHPYGVHTFTADGFGVINETNDQGCTVAPCDFALAKAGFLGNSAGVADGFLTQSNPAPGMIGDIITPGTVGGAPNINAVIVTGPNADGLGGNTLTVNEFNVQGKLVGAAVAPTAPSTPTATAANSSAGTSSALVRWVAPGNGGSAITQYSVRLVNATTGTEVASRLVTPAAGTSTNSLNFTGLTGGIAVRAEVQARNTVGSSAFSARSTAVTPRSGPGNPIIRPANPGAVGGVITARANWLPPASNGGSAINGYVVTALRLSATGRVMTQTVSPVQHFSVRGLTMTLKPGNHRFVVRARNGLGLGVATSARSTIVTAQ